MVSWAHQRTRELADQFLDDAQSFQQRFANAVDALRRGALVFVDTLLDAPGACGERVAAAARGVVRGVSNAAAATLDAAWVVGEAAGWIRARRGRLLALAGAPLVPVVAVLIALSDRPSDDPAGAAVLAVRQDAALAASVHPSQEALATRRPSAVVAPAAVPTGPARTPRVTPAAKRVAAPAAVAAAAVARPARAVSQPQPAPASSVATPTRRAPAPAVPTRRPQPAPAKTVPAAAPASVPHNETKPPSHPEATPPTAAEQPQPPADPAVPTAVAGEDDDDRGDDRKRRKGKRHHDDDHDESDDDAHEDRHDGGHDDEDEDEAEAPE